MPKILIATSSFRIDGNAALARLAQRGFEIVSNPYRRRLTEEEIAASLRPDVVGLITGVEPLTRRVLTGAKGLRVISRCGVGLDNVDLDAARELGIAVHNTPDAPVAAVAELTIGLMLAALRQVAEADRGIRQGRWEPLTGRLLGARTVGLVGYGRVGRAVAKLVRPFGASVIACDPALPGDEAARMCEFDEVIAGADIVSLHAPGGPATHRLIGREQIARMRRGAILINTARGSLVDEDALAEALASGQIAAAGLDVFEHEPYSGPLARLPQVVLTAHMGSRASEVRERMEREAAENLERALLERGVVGSAAQDGKARKDTSIG